MSEYDIFRILALAWLGLAAVVFLTLMFVPAPYGRFTRAGWGPRISSRVGWMLMELPAVLGFGLLWLIGPHRAQPAALVLFAFWMIHYVHRALVFPFRLRGDRRHTTLVTVLLGAVFNVGNGYLNARPLFAFAAPLPNSLLYNPRFIVGVFLFWAGFILNKYSDEVLIHLRAAGETGYRIPFGGPYRWVSCPNYLGEILQWGGWALACWNLGALAFFVWTVANLAPRAIAIHRWYRGEFADYPADRRALVPFLI